MFPATAYAHRMGMRVVWIAFGAATFYLIAAIAVPTVVVVLRSRGVDVDSEATRNITRLAAMIMVPLGGALGMRHALKLEAERAEP